MVSRMLGRGMGLRRLWRLDGSRRGRRRLYFQHPWPSVRWQPAGAYHCPSASHGVTFESPTYDRIVIPDVCEAPSDFYHQGRPSFVGMGPFTDFDAVDCGCPCGCIENVKQTIT